MNIWIFWKIKNSLSWLLRLKLKYIEIWALISLYKNFAMTSIDIQNSAAYSLPFIVQQIEWYTPLFEILYSLHYLVFCLILRVKFARVQLIGEIVIWVLCTNLQNHFNWMKKNGNWIIKNYIKSYLYVFSYLDLGLN